MQSSFTPGPWEATYTDTEGNPVGYCRVGPVNRKMGGFDTFLEVATLYAAEGDPEQQANARLIATAPCLLAELRHAHQMILSAVAIMTPEQLSAWAQANERDGCDGGGATRYHERVEVIAKATWGRS